MGFAKQGKELKKSAFQNRVGKITMQSFKNPKFMIFLSSKETVSIFAKTGRIQPKNHVDAIFSTLPIIFPTLPRL